MPSARDGPTARVSSGERGGQTVGGGRGASTRTGTGTIITSRLMRTVGAGGFGGAGGGGCSASGSIISAIASAAGPSSLRQSSPGDSSLRVPFTFPSPLEMSMVARNRFLPGMRSTRASIAMTARVGATSASRFRMPATPSAISVAVAQDAAPSKRTHDSEADRGASAAATATGGVSGAAAVCATAEALGDPTIAAASAAATPRPIALRAPSARARAESPRRGSRGGL
jgi:hypothetical protein